MPVIVTTSLRRAALGLLPAVALATAALGHGDVAPQPMDTSALPDIGEEWLLENPFRSMGDEVWETAVAIGDSGYNQNCARCHGLGAVSGGLAPDLRFLEADDFGDEWFVERFRYGYTQDGTTKMPGFEEVLDQKAAWAIRTYIEARPDEGALDPFNDRLRALRDQLEAWAASGVAEDEVEAVRMELSEIASSVETASGAPVADSVAFRAARIVDATPAGLKHAAETLTIGLSAAQ